MTKKMLLAPAFALTLALSATPAMAQSAQPAQGSMTIVTNPVQILIGLLLPALQTGAYQPRADETVALILCGANLDPAKLAEPERLEAGPMGLVH